jgi:pyruvate dehydrogenase E2 component (dihydrolipoamide acetyltransferase)
VTTDIVMPRLSPDDAGATLVRWYVSVGSPVAVGDVIAEIESDKAVVELEAQEAGVVERIVVPEGSDDVRADQVLVVLSDDATAASAMQAGAEDAGESSVEPQQSTSPAPAPMSTPAPSPVTASAPGPVYIENMPPPGSDDDSVNATPLARRMAYQAGVRLESITGSGTDGRVLAGDVRTAVGRATPDADAPEPLRPLADGALDLHGGFEPDYEIRPTDDMRRTIAERSAKSKREAPHFYMAVDCRADELLSLKDTLADTGSEDSKVSLNDLLLKVTAQALKQVPALNAAWSDSGIRQFRSVDLAVAVALDDGLITPVIRRAETKRIAEIAAEMRTLVERARAGTLLREEFKGGTFTVTNLGMHGVTRFSAVINPPQAAILAIGAAEEQPVAEDGEVRVAPVMTCTLSVDHRVADGVAAALFLNTFKRFCEDPRLLLL